MKNLEFVEELENGQLKEIEGGKNPLEWVAYGIGYVCEKLSKAAEVYNVPRPIGMY